MKLKTYRNRCNTCGTTITSLKRASFCEACGSDDMTVCACGKTFDITSLLVKIAIGAAVVGTLLFIAF